MDITNIPLNVREKNVLVTGGAGAIGKNLVKSLLQNGARVTVIDNLSSGTLDDLDLKDFTFFEGDICDDAVLDQVFLTDYEYVFHAAAHFANQNSVEHPVNDLFTNALATVKLLEKVKNTQIKRFVYFNTACMYGDNSTFSENETDYDYHTPYSISKHTGEKYAILYHNFYNVPTISVRIFNSYGPFEYAGKYRNVIPNFIDLALRGQSLPVMGDGTDTRSFTFVGDLIHGIFLATANEQVLGHVINIGNDIETSTLELAELINKLTGNDAPVTFIPKRQWDKSTRRKADLSKARKMLHYSPTTTLREGLGRTIEWYKITTKHI